MFPKFRFQKPSLAVRGWFFVLSHSQFIFQHDMIKSQNWTENQTVVIFCQPHTPRIYGYHCHKLMTNFCEIKVRKKVKYEQTFNRDLSSIVCSTTSVLLLIHKCAITMQQQYVSNEQNNAAKAIRDYRSNNSFVWHLSAERLKWFTAEAIIKTMWQTL